MSTAKSAFLQKFQSKISVVGKDGSHAKVGEVAMPPPYTLGGGMRCVHAPSCPRALSAHRPSPPPPECAHASPPGAAAGRVGFV